MKSLIIALLFTFLGSCSGNSQTVKEPAKDIQSPNTQTVNNMKIIIGDTVLTATLVENSSTKALKEALAKAPITIEMSDYGNFEKVGLLGRSFPRNDTQTTTKSGDLILYQGDQFVIYYDSNSYSFTRLGKIDNISQQKLKEILGKGNVTVTLSLQ